MITIAEMSRRIGISRARFYELIEDGIFPAPLKNDKNRPYYNSELESICKEVKETGIGYNGKGQLFYKQKTSFKPKSCDFCSSEYFYEGESKYCSPLCRNLYMDENRRNRMRSISRDELLEKGLEKPEKIELFCKQCQTISIHGYSYHSKDQRWYIRHPCSECYDANNRTKYKQNPQKYHDRYMNGRGSKKKKLRGLSIAYLGGKCCKCDTSEPLHFHHIDPAQKSFTICDYFNKCSYGKGFLSLLNHPMLLKELDKCELLCANHHGLHHHT
jgi:hypothetical protein